MPSDAAGIESQPQTAEIGKPAYSPRITNSYSVRCRDWRQEHRLRVEFTRRQSKNPETSALAWIGDDNLSGAIVIHIPHHMQILIDLHRRAQNSAAAIATSGIRDLQVPQVLEMDDISAIGCFQNFGLRDRILRPVQE